ncbi:aldehyde dehydrogenase family protein, partial [Sedimenticola selenatireducens]
MLDKRTFYINGQWVDPIKPVELEVINPSTEEPCATIALGGQADTDAAVAAARNAFGDWSQSDREQRLALLEKLAEIYQARSNEMAEAISSEMGAPISLAKTA